MATSYATVEEYRLDTGDDATDEERVEVALAQQSAKLRAETGIREGDQLSDDALALCRTLVTDAARKKLVPPSFSGVGVVQGATQASWSANGFSGSYSVQNPSGAAYFDRNTLRDLMRLLGRSMRIGTISPAIGR